jgi:hypothetical protein
MFSHWLAGWRAGGRAQELCSPMVREITFENGEELTEEGLPFLILFYDPNNLEPCVSADTLCCPDRVAWGEEKEINRKPCHLLLRTFRFESR